MLVYEKKFFFHGPGKKTIFGDTWFSLDSDDMQMIYYCLCQSRPDQYCVTSKSLTHSQNSWDIRSTGPSQKLSL